MNVLALEIEIKTDGSSYTSPSFREQVAVAPYNPDYKRDEESKHDAAARLVFLGATLQGALADTVLKLLGMMATELTPSAVEPPTDVPEDDDAEVEDTRNLKKVYRAVTLRLRTSEREAIADFTSTLEVQTDKELRRDRTRELVEGVVAPLLRRLNELLVLNEIIAALPDDPRTELTPDVHKVVDDAAEARSQAWQLQEKLEALRSAKEARARAQALEDAIRAELSLEAAV